MLPLWGEEIGETDLSNCFEWPTQAVFKKMDPSVKLTSIEFKFNRIAETISSVKCNYSNEQSSPVFENDNHSHSSNDTVVFEDVKAVTRVLAGSDDRQNAVWKEQARYLQY